ncbi:MAG TPA: hypothetical protein VIU45_01325 [Chitinophagaceae bacterium]
MGKVEAKTLVDFVETKIDKTLADKTAFHATKEDVALLKEDIARAKSDMIKWAFVFWVGQLAAMFGLLYFFLHK